MPLKKNSKKRTSAQVIEGKALQSPDGELMSLFKPAMLPAVTLNTEQFAFPETFLVRNFSRSDAYKKNVETGWDEKVSGQKIKTGEHVIKLELSDGDAAQQLVNQGFDLDGLSIVRCVITKDIPLQKFENNSTLIKLIKPVVMLGFGGQTTDQLILKAEDCELV